MLGSFNGIGSDIVRFFRVSLSIFAAFNEATSLRSSALGVCDFDMNEAIRFSVNVWSLAFGLSVGRSTVSSTHGVEFGRGVLADGTGGAGRTGRFLLIKLFTVEEVVLSRTGKLIDGRLGTVVTFGGGRHGVISGALSCAGADGAGVHGFVGAVRIGRTTTTGTLWTGGGAGRVGTGFAASLAALPFASGVMLKPLKWPMKLFRSEFTSSPALAVFTALGSKD